MGGHLDEGQSRVTVSPRKDATDAALARLHAHPTYRAHQDLAAFKVTLDGVFAPNFRSLMSLLDQAATDHELGIELIQNVYSDAVARRFRAEASRRLHNYVASTMSLVEHSRRLVRNRQDAVGRAWKERLADLLTNGEVPFMIDLRSFVQHRSLPFLAHSLHIGNPNQEDATWESEVELSLGELLSWDGWKAPARSFLEAKETLPLRPLVRKHADVVWEANAWLLTALRDEAMQSKEEVDRLIIEVNASMMGLSYEEAEAFTLRTSAERRRPRPSPPPASPGS